MTIDRLRSDSEFVDLQVQLWFAKRMTEMERFAKVGALHTEASKLRETATVLNELFPEIRHLSIVNKDSQVILSFGSGSLVTPEQRSWSLAQARTSHTKTVKELHPLPKPQGSFSQREDITAADLVIVIPIFDDAAPHSFLGAVSCEIDVSSLGALLTKIGNRSQSKMFLFDSQNRQVTEPQESSHEQQELKAQIAAARASGIQEPMTFVHYPAASNNLETDFYPNTGNPHAQDSRTSQIIESRYAEYVSIAPAPLPVPWTIVVTLGAGGPTAQIEQTYVQTMEIILALIFLGLGAVKAGSQRVTRALSELAELTSKLSQKSGSFTKSNFLAPPFSEIRALQENFTTLTNSLKARFGELALAREELETRVDERTAMLRATNDSLAQEIAVRQQLTADRDRIISILQASADFVCMFNPEGEVLWLNDFAYRTMELAPDCSLNELKMQNFHFRDSVVHAVCSRSKKHRASLFGRGIPSRNH